MINANSISSDRYPLNTTLCYTNILPSCKFHTSSRYHLIIDHRQAIDTWLIGTPFFVNVGQGMDRVLTFVDFPFCQYRNRSSSHVQAKMIAWDEPSEWSSVITQKALWMHILVVLDWFQPFMPRFTYLERVLNYCHWTPA